MAKRTFEPWIGQHYSTTGLNGLRVLILGEAHYGDPDEKVLDFTKKYIKGLGQMGRFRFFTVTQKVVSGVKGGVTNEARRQFWELVAFCNYIQEFPGNSPRIRPTERMWNEAREPYRQTLEELKPDVVIVLGAELTKRLPKIEGSIAFGYIRHPASFGFSQANAISAIEKVYELAKKSKNEASSCLSTNELQL